MAEYKGLVIFEQYSLAAVENVLSSKNYPYFCATIIARTSCSGINKCAITKLLKFRVVLEATDCKLPLQVTVGTNNELFIHFPEK